MTSLVCSLSCRRWAITGITGAACALFLFGCGSRSGLLGDGAGPESGENGGSAGSGGPIGGAGGGGNGSVCHLSVASPASIPLLAFPEGNAHTPMLVVLDPGEKQGPSGPRPARVASQAVSQDANFWHPELRIAGFTVDIPWPGGVSIDDPPVLVGTDAHNSGLLSANAGPSAGGGLAVLWHRGDEAVGNPTGLKLRAFDTEKWAAGTETFIDPQGTVAHAFRAGKLDGTQDGADGYVASWSSSPAIGAIEPHVAVFDPSGAFAMGPFAVGSVDQSFATTHADVIWTGETHLIAVGATVCTDMGPPCVPGAMGIFRIVPPSGGSSGGVELASSVPFMSPDAQAGHPKFARTGSTVWLTWPEWETGGQSALLRLRLARLDASGQLAGPPELLAADDVSRTTMTAASIDSDLLLAWGEWVNPDLPDGTPGHARIVLHHRNEDGAPIDPPLTIETTAFAAYPSISIVGIRHPRSVLVSWASVEKGGTRSITHLSRLDCASD